MRFIRKIGVHIYLVYIYVKFFIGTLIANVEVEVFGDKADLDEKNKKNIRMRHRNQVLEDFYAGKRNEKYMQDFYEILKRADKFMKNSTPERIAAVADRFSMSYGQKDRWGRRYEHYGFYDEKSKHAGKTLAEVIQENYEERRTKDDDYQMLTIFNNKPKEAGIVQAFRELDVNENGELISMNIGEKSKHFVFPIKVYRDVEYLNKIEQLTEFLHLKRITTDVVQLEFFIPMKYKTYEIPEDSEIFEQLTTIKHIGISDEYGVVRRFGELKYKKRISHKDFDVIKFTGVEMEDLGIY